MTDQELLKSISEAMRDDDEEKGKGCVIALAGSVLGKLERIAASLEVIAKNTTHSA